MTTEHKYAHTLRAIADGETVQCQSSHGEFLDLDPREVLEFIADNYYSPDRYRIKPRTININGFEVPEPVRELLKEGTIVWVPLLDSRERTLAFKWLGKTAFHHEYLADGLVHLTQEAAELHSKALLSFTAKK